jgi:tetratricopeptide (TPR) repeat protein
MVELEAGNPSAGLGHATRIGAANPFATVTLAQALTENARWPEALAEFEARWDRLPEGARMPARPYLAMALAGAGERERARATAREAVSSSRDAGARVSEARALIALARVLVRADGSAARDEVEPALDQAARLAEETGARLFEPAIHETRAELLAVLGDAKTRRHELSLARRLYAEMGADGHAERLARELSAEPE